MMQGNDGDSGRDGGGGGHDRRLEPRPERRGEPGGDGSFDPNALFDVIAKTDSTEQATTAMRRFVAEGNADTLRRAIAIYVRSARARGKSIENVLAELNALSDQQHGRYALAGKLLQPSELKRLVLVTVLQGFDGDGTGEQTS